VSGFLHSYYVSGFYGTNDADTSDLDELENFTFSDCNQSSSNGQTPGTPCNYSGATTTLTQNVAPTGGTVATGTDAGTISSPNTGALPPFGGPTQFSLMSTATGYTWQGAISLDNLGEVMAAMQTAAPSGSNPVPGVLVGVVPTQGGTLASLASGWVFVGIGTNPVTGVAGGAGTQEAILFDGAGGFSSSETTNTWNPTTMTGQIAPTTGLKTCPNGQPAPSGTGLVCGTYTLAADGTITLTFTNGFYAGTTLTGAYNSDFIVLTNVSSAEGTTRILLAGVPQPTTAQQLQACSSGNPLASAAFDGVFVTVAIGFNTSALETQTFNYSASPPYTLTIDGGTLNSGGTLSTLSGGDTASYSLSSTCGISIAHQTDSQGNVFPTTLGAVNADGTAFVLTDFDTQGAGPQTVIGVRISNVQELQ